LLLPAAKGRPRGDRGRGPWRSGRRAAAPRSTRRSTPSGSPSPTQVRSRPPLSSPFPFRLLLSPIRFDPLTCPALLCSRARRWRRPHHGPRRHQVLRHVQAPPRRPQAGTARRSPLPSIPRYYCRALTPVSLMCRVAPPGLGHRRLQAARVPRLRRVRHGDAGSPRHFHFTIHHPTSVLPLYSLLC
jgi:hypothetical protein